MKLDPHKQFEDASPLVDYRYYLPEFQPLRVRFAKAMIGSKYLFRTIMGSGLGLFGAAVVAETLGGHNFEKQAKCEVVYYQNTSWWWDDPRYERRISRAETETGSMINVFEACGDMLNTMDGEDRIFVDYSSLTHVSNPAVNFINDGTSSFGLSGAQLMAATSQDRLAEAIGSNEREQRWLVNDYMRIAGRSYTFENIELQYDQKYYEASDYIESRWNDVQYWYDEKKQKFSNDMDRLWAQLNPF